MNDRARTSRRFGARYVIALTAAVAVVFAALDSAALTEWLDWHVFGRTDTLRLGAYEGDVGALEWIAQERGFFAKTGLNVEMAGFASGKAATEALRAGQVDVATAADYVVVSRSFAEPDLAVLGSISYYRNKAVVGRRDHGIRDARDLRGKRIGVTSPSSSEYSLNVFLALNGVDSREVKFVPLEPQQLVQALAAGTVDAAITWEPHVLAMQRALGAEAVTFEGRDFDAYLLLVARREGLAERSRAVRKLLQALLLAEDWARSHPEEAKRLVAARFKLEEAAVDGLWPRMWLEVRLPQELLATMDGQARWLVQNGRAPAAAIPNYARFVRSDELKSVRPAAVTLFAEAPREQASESAAKGSQR
ncbi:MAG: ABC transporter substrate-binding protein [Ignavibacteria bacterium]